MKPMGFFLYINKQSQTTELITETSRNRLNVTQGIKTAFKIERL